MNIANFPGTENNYLRKWQMEALPSFLERLSQKKVEVTVAVQGSGKTLYSAACFASAVTLNKGLHAFNLQQIKEEVSRGEGLSNNFAVIFIPNTSIVDTTIRDWDRLGISLERMENDDLQNESIPDLISRGINGIIVTYQQSDNNNKRIRGVWENNTLVKFLKTKGKVIVHAILDECHKMTLRNNGKKPTLHAKYFLSNHSLFSKLHLISGTPSKGSGQEIPFVMYDQNKNIVADTYYSQNDAIKDGVIVPNQILVHRLKSVELIIDNQEVELTEDDLAWYTDNFAKVNRCSSNEDDKNMVEKLDRIEESFIGLCKKDALWEQLLTLGDKWLNETRKQRPSALGIIFAPNIDTAISIYKRLLPNRSVLCVTKDKRTIGCKVIKPEDRSSYLRNNVGKIDWVITCMALREGFDHPDCKVCILLPKLSFLTQTDISQMLGRTNRSIKGFPNLVATCITLGFRPVLDLIANNERNDVVLCEPDSTHSDILDYFAQKAKDDQFKAIESALRAEEWAKNNENNKSELLTENNEPELSIGSNDAFLSFLIPEPSITIKSIVLEAKADILGTNKTVEYSPEILKANAEINIRSCWLNWLDLMTIMARENKLPEEIKRIPPSEMGVYYVINAKTQEWLYVGQSHDLLDRTSDSQRFFQATWIAKEGWQDVFINWKVCDNCDEVEVAMIHELKPKYNDIRYKLK
jgi:hypothetical protein